MKDYRFDRKKFQLTLQKLMQQVWTSLGPPTGKINIPLPLALLAYAIVIYCLAQNQRG